MLFEDKKNYARTGKITCWTTFILGIVYIIVTILGFISLNSPDEPIGDPYFSLMEILTLMIAPLMAMNMIAIHYHASSKYKIYSLFGIFSMFIMAGITSCVHFVVLTMNHQIDTTTMKDLTLLFSFNWPSVVYIFDILAWDWFFALSFLFTAPIFNIGKLERTIRALMVMSGILSLTGLLGVPLENMQVRNIGIIGYALMAPFVFLLIGINFNRIQIKKTNAQQRV